MMRESVIAHARVPKIIRDAWHSQLFRVSSLLAEASVLLPLCGSVIAASLILGGGTRGGFLSDAILQLVAIPLLLVALLKLFEVPLTRQMRIPLLLCLAIVLIPVVQLIPLPPWLWTNLPGRQISAETFEILGQGTPWMPISVVPHETWLSALSLIPPLGIFVATIQLSYRDRRRLTWVFLTIGIVAAFIGLLQIAQGPLSTLRFFEITNETEAVGLFANRNHFAALLYALILFSIVWAINATASAQKTTLQNLDTATWVAIIGSLIVLVILLAGLMMTRSRVGLGLTIVALFGGIALAVLNRHRGSTFTITQALVGSGILVFVFGSQFALYRVMERFNVDTLDDYRFAFARNTLEAALYYLPFGSGLGTYVPVYATFEKPQDLLAGFYANRAHNDFLELWLNTGLIGLTLAAMIISWLALRAAEIWRSPPPQGASDLDWDFARAATLIVALLIVHSFFDYPLRTGAIMAVMAFACALLIEPPFVAEPATTSGSSFLKRTLNEKKKKNRKASQSEGEGAIASLEVKPQPIHPPELKAIAPPSIPAAPTPTPTEKLAPRVTQSSEGAGLSPAQRWGTDVEVEWPEEWSKKPSSSDEKSDKKTAKESKSANGS